MRSPHSRTPLRGMLSWRAPAGRAFRLTPYLLVGALALALAAPAAAQTRREEKKREVLDYKAYERERDRELYGELANEKRQEAIAQLKEILATQRLPPDTKAEMLMRLAELYFEQSKYEYNSEMSDYDERYEEWFNMPEAQQKKTPEPKIVKSGYRFTRSARNAHRDGPTYFCSTVRPCTVAAANPFSITVSKMRWKFAVISAVSS